MLVNLALPQSSTWSHNEPLIKQYKVAVNLLSDFYLDKSLHKSA